MSPANSKSSFIFNLYGQPVNVNFSDPADWSDDAMGRANSRTWIITLADNLYPSVERNTLLHEMLHLICDVQDVELSEAAVNTLTNGLLDIFNHNPEMKAKVFGE